LVSKARWIPNAEDTMALTQKQVRGLKPDPERKRGEYFLWDFANFGVHVRGSGRATFVCKYRADGQQRMYTIGSADRISLADARKAAHRILADVERGRDPVQQRREKRQRGLTVADLSEKWLDTVELRPTTRKLYEHNLHLSILPAFGKRSASKLTPADVRRLYFTIQDAGHETKANRVNQTLAAMLSWGQRRDLIPTNPAAGAIARQDRSKEKADNRHLSEAEAGRFLTACEKLRAEGGNHGRVAVGFELMLFAGLRPSDVFPNDGYGLKWSEIDADAGLIRFENQKAGTAPAYLNGPARSLLASLDREPGDVFVFPSNRTGRALADVRRTWEKIVELAEFEDPRPAPKCLRKTFATLGRAWGFGLEAIKPLLRHSERGDVTTAHYAHADGATIGQAAEGIAVKLAALSNPNAEVIPIKN
jgi:integrase